MLHDVHRRRWRRLAIALSAGVTAVAAPAAATAPAAGMVADAAGIGCHAAGASAAAAAPRVLRGAVVCLVNRRRAVRGLPALRHDRALARAAGRHARDMARRAYFAHQRAGGPDLGARVRRAGWQGRSYGETIAYGCGAASTPRAAVRLWMASPGHRVVILGRGYGRVGPGVVRRAPVPCAGGATWVLDFGGP